MCVHVLKFFVEEELSCSMIYGPDKSADIKFSTFGS